MGDPAQSRRPIKARSSGWAQRVAAALARSNVTPNQISVASIVFAALGAAALLLCQGWAGKHISAAAIQARLLCNLFDGLVAVEHNKQSPLGGLYNEFPDRIADSVLIVALGYAAGLPWLGWFGALAAALTAYVRVAGGTLGLKQDFRGPMTIACVVAIGEQAYRHSNYALQIAAWVIALGALVTCVTRTLAIARQLR
jgi:phosphatidylglycerophosphate synthase